MARDKARHSSPRSTGHEPAPWRPAAQSAPHHRRDRDRPPRHNACPATPVPAGATPLQTPPTVRAASRSTQDLRHGRSASPASDGSPPSPASLRPHPPSCPWRAGPTAAHRLPCPADRPASVCHTATPAAPRSPGAAWPWPPPHVPGPPPPACCDPPPPWHHSPAHWPSPSDPPRQKPRAGTKNNWPAQVPHRGWADATETAPAFATSDA